MPGGDGSGPMGMGQMTGRGAGFCAGFGMPGFANRYGGFGRGAGRGLGMGFRARFVQNWNYTTPSPARAWHPGVVDEQAQLKNQAEVLKAQLDALQKRINELEKNG